MSNNVKFLTGNIQNLPETKAPGQVYFALDGKTGSIYYDESTSSRILMESSDLIHLTVSAKLTGEWETLFAIRNEFVDPVASISGIYMSEYHYEEYSTCLIQLIRPDTQECYSGIMSWPPAQTVDFVSDQANEILLHRTGKRSQSSGEVNYLYLRTYTDAQGWIVLQLCSTLPDTPNRYTDFQLKIRTLI